MTKLMEQTKFKMECHGCGAKYEASWHAAELAISNGVRGYCTKTQQFERNSIELRWWEKKLRLIEAIADAVQQKRAAAR